MKKDKLTETTLDFANLSDNILEWGTQKGIIGAVGASKDKQALKMASEAGETCDAVAKGDAAEIKDGIGDTVVTLILLAELHDLTLEECLEAAWDVIKSRTGETVNGVFIKD